MGNADITAGVDGEVEDACDGSRQKVPSSFSVSVSVVTASVVLSPGDPAQTDPNKDVWEPTTATGSVAGTLTGLHSMDVARLLLLDGTASGSKALRRRSMNRSACAPLGRTLAFPLGSTTGLQLLRGGE